MADLEVDEDDRPFEPPKIFKTEVNFSNQNAVLKLFATHKTKHLFQNSRKRHSIVLLCNFTSFFRSVIIILAFQ